jgi:hypothetical protein
MLKDGRPIGAIAMARSQTGRFPDRQVELLKTFADQAVIAIENTRLFDEVQARSRDAAVGHDFRSVAMLIVMVRADVRDFLDCAGEDRAGRCAHPSGYDGINASYGLNPFGRQSVLSREMDKFPVETEHVTELGLAEPRHAPRNGVKYGLSVGR